ncbi:MAG: hypothetical protein FJW39_32080 [Acidobacteria bacterium]|nr:hypothetical protein [Acidobacteriota bacterium]
MVALGRLLAAALGAATLAQAIEISTGRMLGAGHDPRAFYVRTGNGPWRKTYTGPEFRPEAAGRLMNLRVAQAVTHDEWLTEEAFDPESNTSRAIAALDTYKAHGILSISVSLQGANQAYERTPGIKRVRDAKAGPGKGALMSAYRPDGSIKPEWLRRTLRLARELDRRGMILNLMYFYAHQDEVFENTAAIRRAVSDTTDWIIANNLRNVIIEIANEHDINGWDHGLYIHNEMGSLITLARSRFEARKAAFRLPITASTGGKMAIYDGVRQHGDITAIHGNNKTPEVKRSRTAGLHADPSMPGPILMNEDDNGRETTLANLKRELDSCDAVFQAGGSWGYMPWRQLQIHPFRFYAPASHSRVADPMPVEERDPVYFKAVLEHIRSLVYNR